MKRILLLSVCSLAILICHTSFAQSREDLLGKWQIDTNESITLLSPESKTQFDNLDDNSRTQLLNDLTKQRFIFNSDSTFLVGTMGAQFFDGTWTLDGSALNLAFYSGAELQHQVAVPQQGALIVTVSASTENLFNSIYLTQSPTE